MASLWPITSRSAVAWRMRGEGEGGGGRYTRLTFQFEGRWVAACSTCLTQRPATWCTVTVGTTNDPNVSGPARRQDPGCVAPNPGGAQCTVDGQEQPMSATTIPSLEPADVAWRTNPSKLSVVKAVGRRMVPYLIEATIIPTALFYVFLITFELKWAIVGPSAGPTPRSDVGSSPAARSLACWCSPRWGSRCAPSSICSVATVSSTFFSRSCGRSSPPPCSPCRCALAGRSSPGSPATSAR